MRTHPFVLVAAVAAAASLMVSSVFAYDGGDHSKMEQMHHKLQEDIREMKMDQQKLSQDRERVRQDRMEMMRMQQDMTRYRMDHRTGTGKQTPSHGGQQSKPEQSSSQHSTASPASPTSTTDSSTHNGQ